MGYDLTNNSGGYHQWKVVGWWYLLNLARHYGWSPVGTRLARGAAGVDATWNGNYFENSGQEVCAEDAQAIAEALQRLLSDPHRERAAREVAAKLGAAIAEREERAETSPLDTLRYPLGFVRDMMNRFGQSDVGTWRFDEQSDAYLKEFVAFCQLGAFRIE